jgi:retron-type reverse transcriptase
MKRAGGLYPKIIEFDNIYLAAHKALRGKKLSIDAAKYNFNLENEILNLQFDLINQNYQLKPYQVFEILEPKFRKICAANFRDRVLHHSVCNILEPIFERRFIYDTYACRVGKGTHKAIARVQLFARKSSYYLKCDIKKYFESIDHEILRNLLRKIIKDADVLLLLNQIIDHSVPGAARGKSVPIGNLTSQHFANIYLGELDHFLKDRLALRGYVRYMDDFICFADEKEDLHYLLDKIKIFLTEQLCLSLKEKVTRIAPVSEGVPFLGMRIFKNLIRIQRPNLIRCRQKIREREHQYQSGTIDEKTLLQSVSSLLGHISHANSFTLRRKEFAID